PPATIPGHPGLNKLNRTAWEKTTSAQMAADQEVAKNADAVRRALGPEIDKAIEILPAAASWGMGTRANVWANAAGLNPKNNAFPNLRANGDPRAKNLQMLVTATIPFIRALSLGTKGNRLTRSEIQLLTEDNLQRLSRGEMSQDEAKQTLIAIR